MKRFAAHYLFLPNVGFMKQQVVEISDEGTVRCFFPLTEEIESVEWMPGVIALLSKDEIERIKSPMTFMENVIGLSEKKALFVKDSSSVLDPSSPCFKEAFLDKEKRGEELFLCLFYPFDFTSMQPVAGTRHRLLR